MTSPIDVPWALSYKLFPIGNYPLKRLVSEMLNINCYRHTWTHKTDTSSENKGRLNLAAREPVSKQISK